MLLGKVISIVTFGGVLPFFMDVMNVSYSFSDSGLSFISVSLAGMNHEMVQTKVISMVSIKIPCRSVREK